jgi:hypothetical protein
LQRLCASCRLLHQPGPPPGSGLPGGMWCHGHGCGLP